MKFFVRFAPVIAILAFMYYAYKGMAYSFTLEVDSVSQTSLIELFVITLSLSSFLYLKPQNSRFFSYWIIWIIWVVFIFLFGMGGAGLANILHMLFCPMCFVLFYNCSAYSNGFSKAILIAAIALFVFTSYQHIILSNSLTGRLSADVFASSNYIYWPLCCIPFVFCVEKNYLRYVLLFLIVIDVIISQKRAPLIAVSLFLVVFLLREMKSSRSYAKIFVVVAVTAGFFLISYKYGDYVAQLIGRVNMISEDEGSGRVPLWNDVFRSLERFSFADIILGKGYGSIKLTGHTNAHNDALQMLYEYGIIGLTFYIIMLSFFLKRTLFLLKKNSKFFNGYFAALSILLVMGAVSNLTVSNNYVAFICAFCGFVEAQLYVKKDFHEVALN